MVAMAQSKANGQGGGLVPAAGGAVAIPTLLGRSVQRIPVDLELVGAVLEDVLLPGHGPRQLAGLAHRHHDAARPLSRHPVPPGQAQPLRRHQPLP